MALLHSLALLEEGENGKYPLYTLVFCLCNSPPLFNLQKKPQLKEEGRLLMAHPGSCWTEPAEAVPAVGAGHPTSITSPSPSSTLGKLQIVLVVWCCCCPLPLFCMYLLPVLVVSLHGWRQESGTFHKLLKRAIKGLAGTKGATNAYHMCLLPLQTAPWQRAMAVPALTPFQTTLKEWFVEAKPAGAAGDPAVPLGLTLPLSRSEKQQYSNDKYAMTHALQVLQARTYLQTVGQRACSSALLWAALGTLVWPQDDIGLWLWCCSAGN